MKAIVTGATGFLGQHLLTSLSQNNWHCIALGRDKRKGHSLANANVTFIPVDISDPAQTKSAFAEADVVFHCASLSSPWGSWREFYQANVIGTQNVLSASRHYKIPRLIYVSTTSIYFDYRSRLNIHESDPLPVKFVNHYAHTKHLAEQVLLQRSNAGSKTVSDSGSDSDLECIIIRPRGIIGEGDQAIMPRILRVAKRGRFPLFNQGHALIDLSYVKNVAKALCLAAGTDNLNNQCFNISNDQPMQIRQLLSTVFDALNLKVKFKSVPYQLVKLIAHLLETTARLTNGKEPPITAYGIGLLANSQTLNIDKAKSKLAYKPDYTIEEGISRYAEWIKQQ